MSSDYYVIGCLSTCDNSVGVLLRNGSCCQADLPTGLRYYQGCFNLLYNTTKLWKTTPCNYVTVMETAVFNFSTTYLTSKTAFYNKYYARPPIVMEWAIAKNTCEEGQINITSYACVSTNSTNGAGYACNCSDGYKGNPYIIDGCTIMKDIFQIPAQVCRASSHWPWGPWESI
ncbi:unnamed protein product [Urochloa humidicola]